MNYKCTYQHAIRGIFTGYHNAPSPEHAAMMARFYWSLPNDFPITVTFAYDAESILDAALAQVESASIREWAQQQRATWLKIAESYLGKAKEPKPESLAICISAKASGLW
jgi:hypothetical protein